MKQNTCPSPGSYGVAITVAIVLISCTARTPASAEAKKQEQLCSALVTAASLAREERQQKHLAELEQQLMQRVSELEERRRELQKILEQIETFAQKTDAALTELYARMPPKLRPSSSTISMTRRLHRYCCV